MLWYPYCYVTNLCGSSVSKVVHFPPFIRIVTSRTCAAPPFPKSFIVHLLQCCHLDQFPMYHRRNQCGHCIVPGLGRMGGGGGSGVLWRFDIVRNKGKLLDMGIIITRKRLDGGFGRCRGGGGGFGTLTLGKRILLGVGGSRTNESSRTRRGGSWCLQGNRATMIPMLDMVMIGLDPIPIIMILMLILLRFLSI